MLAANALAQITTAGSTPANLVQNVLLGAGVTASNITYTGYVNGISTFSATPSTGLGFSAGVYLTSGSYLSNDPNGSGIDGPQGPSINMQSVDQVGFFGTPYSDSDLDAIVSPNSTEDAAVLEFDFIPQSDTVKFRYIFGSEEYNDYVNSGFNDVFAFILSGVSTPLAPTNIALIPGTSTPISINNVNNGGPYSGVSSGPCNNCSYYRDNVNGSIDCVYDGLTVVLTAIHPVICGETYHIKIAIADVGDEALDSGVFLEAGSFSSPASFNVSSSVNGSSGVTEAYEGCDTMALIFVRPVTDTAVADTQSIIITGTATNGTDYATIPTAIIFPQGEDTVVFTFIPILDGLTEGTDTIEIIVPNVSVCGNVDSVHYQFTIHDTYQITLSTVGDSICPGLTGNVSATVTGGVGTINYSWSNGNTTSGFSDTPSSTTTYTITVDDQCGATSPATATASIVVIPTFTINLPPDPSYCSNVATASVTATTTPTVAGQWLGTGIVDAGSGVGLFNPNSLPVGQTTFTYFAGSSGCNQMATYTVTVNQFVSAAMNSIPNICAGGQSFSPISSNGGGNWYLDNSLLSALPISTIGLTTGVHQVKYVIADANCPDSSTVSFTVYPKPEVSFSADTTQGCLIGGSTINFNAQLSAGSVPNGTYIWSFGDGVISTPLTSIVHAYGFPGTYPVSLIYIDPNNCTDDTSAVGYITIYPQPDPDFYFTNEEPSTLNSAEDMINITPTSNNTYLWTIYDSIAISQDVNAHLDFDSAGTYYVTLIATSTHNCIDSITHPIKVVNDLVAYVPNAFSPNGDGKNDLFFIKGFGIDEKSDFYMKIFDRWGEKIFETHDINEGWNGTKNNAGGRIIVDTYIYKIVYTNLDKKQAGLTGKVTLVH